MTSQPKLPTLTSPYIGVYRLNAPGPLESTDVEGVRLKTGPFELQRSVPIVTFADGATSATMGVQRIPFGPGVYLILVQEVEFGPPSKQAEAALAVAEKASLIELHFPELIAEKQFEGIVNRPGTFTFAPDGPMTMTARPFEGLDGLLEGLRAANGQLLALPPDDRERFRLAARWFRRGCETLNLVDKLLFWFIALEVFPAVGDTDVPKHVRDLIHARCYPTLDAGAVKDRIGIGRIAGLRARIVHDGLSSVPEQNRADFDLRLSQLNAIVRTCLRILAQVEPGTDLDRWVNSEA